MKKRLYWPNMANDIKLFINSCSSCQINKPKIPAIHTPLYPIQKPNAPFKHWHMDVMGPLPSSSRGHKFILIFVDAFSKYLVAIPIRNQKATTIAELFIENILTKFGIPLFISSDRGTNFMSEIIKDIAELLGINQKFSTAWHQSANGQAERYVQTVQEMLAHFLNENKSNWDQILPFVLMAFNSSINDSTKESPFFLIHGQEMRLPIDITLKTNLQIEEEDFSIYRKLLIKNVEAAWKIVENNLEEAREKMKIIHDEKFSAKETKLEENDLVVKRVELRNKFEPKFEGPYRILKICEPNATIRAQNSTKIEEVHLDKLRPFLLPKCFPLSSFLKEE